MIAKLIIYVSIVFMAYSNLVQPGELLGGFRKYIYNSKLPEFVKKMWTCPYCLAGRISLYISIYMVIKGNEIDVFISVPAVIVIVYTYTKIMRNT